MTKAIVEHHLQNPTVTKYIFNIGAGHVPQMVNALKDPEFQKIFPQARIFSLSAYSEQCCVDSVMPGKMVSLEKAMQILKQNINSHLEESGLAHVLEGYEDNWAILPKSDQHQTFGINWDRKITDTLSDSIKTQKPDLSNAKPRILIVEIPDHRDVMSNMAWLLLFKRFLEEGVIKTNNTSFLFENHDEKISAEELELLEDLGEKFKDLSMLNAFFNDPHMVKDVHNQATIAEGLNNAAWRKFAKEKGLNILNLETHEKVSANVDEIFTEESRRDMAEYNARAIAKEAERNADMVENILKAINDNVIIFVGAGHSPGLRTELQRKIPAAKIDCATSVSEQVFREVFKDGKKGRTPVELLEHIIEQRNQVVKRTVFASSLDDHVVTAAILGESQYFLDFNKNFTDAMRRVFERTPKPSPSQATVDKKPQAQQKE